MSEWAPPEEFDDYVIERPLGGGAMGRVYLAHDAVLARPVAVKFIAAVDPDAASRQRFLLEARATARLQHPNVVAIYRVGELDARPYIVTEFVRGDTLDSLPLPLPPDRVLALGIDLARGLAAAHRRGVIHGDIKPANAIVGEDGVAKLLDFGLATLADAAPAGRPRAIAGTPDYMAPELWRGAPADRRTDVYAFGGVLYHLIAGHPPFHDVPPRDLARVVQERDPPGLQVRSGDAGLAAAIDRCLARDPAQRWASGDELREALEQCRAHAAAAPVLPGGNPYRGLRPFEADHRLLFFGRAAELGVVIDRLRAEPFVLVSGESGSGKSSLCRAAVLPSIADGALGDGRTWSSVQLVPGRRPLRALAAALAAALDTGEDTVASILRGDGAGIRAFVRDKLGAGRGLVVFVDQLEELATIAEPDEATAADRALARLGSPTPGLRLLATARADFLGRLAALPDLGEQLTRALSFLRPLGPDEIREVIVGPAQATGIRFETDAMVDELVAATAGTDGGLPLLQFALAELWTARDVESGVITAAALASLGGVEGALSRHADSVIAALTPAQAVAARRSLTRLVTPEGTRARRTEAELGAGEPATRAALDALVRGRLLVAHEADDGSAYELSHEVLVRGWGTLRTWLVEDADQRLLVDRVHQAASEWTRLHRAREALWGTRQLAEAVRIREAELQPVDREFLAASRRRVGRRRWAVRGAIVAVPALVVAIYFGVEAANRRALTREVDGLLAAANRELAAAHDQVATADALRARSLAAFDALAPTAEDDWKKALDAGVDADRKLARASRAFEGALLRDPERDDVRAGLGGALLERAVRADRDGRRSERDELIQRLAVYDRDGGLIARWTAPATVRLRLAAATVVLTRYEEGGATSAAPPRALPPNGSVEVAPGSYLLTASAPDRATVRYPFLAERGGSVAIAFELPPASRVPPGFVAIPPGVFLFGSQGDEEARSEFFHANPQHARSTEGFLIAIHEVTFADWIAFLDALPPADRARRTPRATGDVSGAGSVSMSSGPAGWRVSLNPAGQEYAADAGQPIVYASRDRRASQDWLRCPVLGISAIDAEAYARWADTTGLVPGARLCTELEWERAGRGADPRTYPHGDRLLLDDVNIDQTYAKQPGGMGPDEVGDHPGSDSPFGVADMVGNAFEWTRSIAGDAYVLRGGSYYYDSKSGALVNRNESTPTVHLVTVGFRLCASWPSS